MMGSMNMEDLILPASIMFFALIIIILLWGVFYE